MRVIFQTVLIITSTYQRKIIQTNVQARSQMVARKPGPQHHMGLDARNPDFVPCEQQRRRPACVSAQSDQRLYFSPSEIKFSY